MDAQWLDFDELLEPFGHLFFIKFRNHANLVNYNISLAKFICLLHQALNFSIRNQLKFMFFQDAIYDPIFLILFEFISKKLDCWTPLEIQLGPKWHLESSNWRPKAIKKHRGRSLFRGLEIDTLPKGRPKRPKVHFV